MITHVGCAVGGGQSLIDVGNVAPPNPTTPHSLILSTNCFWSSLISMTTASERSMFSIQSSPSTSLITVITGLPAISFTGSIERTVPETEEWTGAETNPFGFAISCPTFTLSPGFTIGSAGAPRCWPIEIYATFGTGSFSIAASEEIFLSEG